ncbi:PAS domain-containing sensor histidine kinase [Dehalogenimonas formicexedens]|nr:PAS domain-containing sensor histidine kinase [Dehalogenimonas formicexedens]
MLHSGQTLETAYKFLAIANRHVEIRPLLVEFLAEFKGLTGCSAVGILVLDGEQNTECAVFEGFCQDSFKLENFPVTGIDRRICTDVIAGTTDPSKPFYTEIGSFFINRRSDFRATVSDDEKGQPRNDCNAHGYESVALIPIRSGTSIFGLIHVADMRENMVPASLVGELEKIGLVLGNAIQRVRLTQSLRDSEQRFRALFDNTGDAIILWEVPDSGGETRVIESNQVACDRYGYTRDEMLRLTARDLNTPESYAKTNVSSETFQRTGHLTVQLVHRTKSGQPIPSEVAAHRFELNGKPVILSVIRDIRKRLEQEAEIRSLAAFALSNPSPILRLSNKGVILFANPAAVPLLREWRVSIGDVLPSPWPERASNNWKTGEEFETEIEIGGTAYALTLFPDKENGFLNLYGLDITSRKTVERQLKESLDRLEKLNNSLPDAIFVVRRPGNRIEYVNRRVIEMYGYAAEQCLGRTPGFLFPDRASYLAQSRRLSVAIRGGKAAEGLRTETFQRRESGEVFPCELIQTFQSHPDGSLSTINIVRDTTEQRNSQAEIERYQHRLEDMVAVRTQALGSEIIQRQKAENDLRLLFDREQTLSSALRQQIEERSLYTRALVHELKTPLTPLLTASDYLEASLTDETARRFAHNIKAGARNMEKRINELLDLARGEVGTLRLTYRSFDLVGLLAKIAEYVQPEAAHRGIHLELDLPQTPIQISADPDRLRQVVSNLLSNAFKFCRKGGHVKISVRPEADGPLIAVADDGTGISTADLPHIFEAYHRGQNTDKKRLGGLGLGLALAKMFVELHGGQIWLKSAIGKGSTFYFKVPCSKS